MKHTREKKVKKNKQYKFRAVVILGEREGERGESPHKARCTMYVCVLCVNVYQSERKPALGRNSTVWHGTIR